MVSGIFIFSPTCGNDPIWQACMFQLGRNHQVDYTVDRSHSNYDTSDAWWGGMSWVLGGTFHLGDQKGWNTLIITHTRKLTWNTKITQVKRNIIFQTLLFTIFGFHVNFPGCSVSEVFFAKWQREDFFAGSWFQPTMPWKRSWIQRKRLHCRMATMCISLWHLVHPLELGEMHHEPAPTCTLRIKLQTAVYRGISVSMLKWFHAQWVDWTNFA